MPQLPESIWKRRLENEYSQLAASGEKFEANSDHTEYLVSVSGKALAKRGEELVERDKHAVQITLTRSYPYPGGIEVTWISPIFHPNIRAEDGAVCIQLINQWSETQTITSVVKALKQLLANPNPESPLNHEAASYYKYGDSQPKNGPKIINTA